MSLKLSQKDDKKICKKIQISHYARSVTGQPQGLYRLKENACVD